MHCPVDLHRIPIITGSIHEAEDVGEPGERLGAVNQRNDPGANAGPRGSRRPTGLHELSTLISLVTPYTPTKLVTS